MHTPNESLDGDAAESRPSLFPLPDGDWTIDERSHLYWSEETRLFFDDTTGYFYDPDSEMWYNPVTKKWFYLEDSRSPSPQGTPANR